MLGIRRWSQGIDDRVNDVSKGYRFKLNFKFARYDSRDFEQIFNQL